MEIDSHTGGKKWTNLGYILELESSGVADWLAVVEQGAGAGIVYERRGMKNDSRVLV